MLTNEQYTIINTINNSSEGTFLINAVAGSGKTQTAVELTNTLEGVGYYLVFGKANATEMKTRVSNTFCKVSTIHSLAWNSGIPFKKPDATNKLSYTSSYYFKPLLPADLSLITTKKHKTESKDDNESKDDKVTQRAIKDIYAGMTQRLYNLAIQSTDVKIADNWTRLVNTMDESERQEHGSNLDLIKPVAIKLVKERFTKLTEKAETIDLAILPKLLYQYLHFNRISLTADYVLIDESQDLTETDLGIIENIQAKKKIFLGDPYQSIFAFRGTGSAFEHHKDKGVQLKLSKSFRIPIEHAKKVEHFGRNYLSESFTFKGSKHTPTTNRDAVIFRTNLAMILYIAQAGYFEFKTLKPLSEVFGPTLKALEFLNNPHKNAHADLQNDFTLLYYIYTDWVNMDKDATGGLLYKELVAEKAERTNNITLAQLLRIDSTIGLLRFKRIYQKLLEANSPPNDTSNYTIVGTAHAFKGFTVDTAHIDSGFAESLKQTLNPHLPDQGISEIKYLNLSDSKKQEWLLYYVAVTRATKEITGYLDPLKLSLEELAASLRKVDTLKPKIKQTKFNLFDVI